MSRVACRVDLGETQPRAADCTHCDFTAAASNGRANMNHSPRFGGFIGQMNLGVLCRFRHFNPLGDSRIAAVGEAIPHILKQISAGELKVSTGQSEARLKLRLECAEVGRNRPEWAGKVRKKTANSTEYAGG